MDHHSGVLSTPSWGETKVPTPSEHLQWFLWNASGLHLSLWSICINSTVGNGEAAEQVRILTVLPENLGWVSSTHTRPFTAADNPNSRGSDFLASSFAFLGICTHVVCGVHLEITHTHMHTQRVKINKI